MTCGKGDLDGSESPSLSHSTHYIKDKTSGEPYIVVARSVVLLYIERKRYNLKRPSTTGPIPGFNSASTQTHKSGHN